MDAALQLALGLESVHHNQYLFSDHCLNHLLPGDPRWAEALPEAEPFLAWLQGLYAREAEQSGRRLPRPQPGLPGVGDPH